MRTIDLARAVGLSAQQVRNYEAWGFLPPVERSESGYRLYTERHLEALRTARTMIFAGYGWHTALGAMRAVHSENLDAALALVDERHAEIHRERREIDAAVDALKIFWRTRPIRAADRGTEECCGSARPRERSGCVPSALRFWEQQELLQPGRDESSGYRLYDQRQMRQLKVVALLRGADYDFDAIRSVLKELAKGRPEAAMRAVEKRRNEISASSRACAKATAALWNYSGEIH